MTSTKFWDFLTPSPLFAFYYTIRFTQPPLLRPLFHDPPPPPMRTSYLEAPSVGETNESATVLQPLSQVIMKHVRKNINSADCTNTLIDRAALFGKCAFLAKKREREGYKRDKDYDAAPP